MQKIVSDRACWLRFLERIQPEPILLVSEWADRNRILPSKGGSEPGPWRTSRTPYLKGILDALSTGSPYHTVVFAKGSQIGASEAGLNWLAYCIHHAPAPMLMVQPTLDMCKRISKQRIQPMIDETPCLSERIAESRARDAGNTLFQKDFPAGTFVMTGANSAAGLRSMPARYLFLDEVDAYPGDVEGEGDPIELAIARTSTFKRNRKIYLCSTPTIEGQSRIWSAFEQTDQRYYFVPCPHCDEYQRIEWGRIVWNEGHPDEAALACEHCGVMIEERYKGQMLARGEWRSTHDGQDARVAGFHLSSLYAPPGWYSWSDAAKEFASAKGFPEKLQSFINTKLGECWEDRTGEKIDQSGLMARREQWDHVPEDVVLITAGVDVQGDRLEVSIIGYTAKDQSRVLHHLRLYGNPGEPKIWQTLDDLLLQPLMTETGALMSIRAACIDSGGHHTQEVYKFCGERAGRRVMAIKGRAGALPIWPTKLSRKKLKHGASLHIIGVDTAKDVIHSSLSVIDPDLPKYVAFSAGLPEDYFGQLVAERRVPKVNKSGFTTRTWVKKSGDRNEALDCFVYALAALKMLESGRPHLLRFAKPQHSAPPPGQTKTPATETAPPRPPATRRTSSAIL
jgi:phage terminase large subunit GpA-like protein